MPGRCVMVSSGLLCVTSLMLGPACTAPPAPNSADAFFGEWSAGHVIASDPSGDATGAFDVTSVSAQSDGTVLRIRFDAGNAGKTLQSGDGGDGTLRLELSRAASTITIDMRARTAYLNGNPGNAVAWGAVGWTCAPTYAAPEYEAVIDVGAAIGASVGDTVSINFSGSDALSAAAMFTLTAPALPIPSGDPGRHANAQLRLASLNTLQTGLLDAGRGPRLGRLIAGVNADIYCFNEEYDSNSSQIAAAMNGFFPIDIAWQVAKEGDNVIASPFPVTQVFTGTSRYAAALVDHPAGPVFVICLHLKCCGHAGNSDDAQRISQAQGIAQLIAGFRAGVVNGGALADAADAAVIVAGDWNLVGSRAPLNIIEDAGSGPGLVAPVIRHLVGTSAYTWRNDPSSFWPGRLDLVAYSPENLRRMQAYVLDSAVLDAAQLEALDVLPSDSAATDHLVLVSDFAMTCEADTDGDQAVNLDDLQSTLFAFGQVTDPFHCADVDGSGVIDLLDLQMVLFSFGGLCPVP